MTANSNFVYYEDVMVSKARTATSYKVDLELEGYTFFIKKDMVDEITKNGEEESLIAIIIAYINYARACRNADNNRKAKKLSKEVLTIGISKLLKKYSVESIIDVIKSLKWHEICKVLESKNPVKEIEEII